MKKSIVALLALLLITSCGSDLDCNSEIAKQTVKDILIDLESSNQNKPIYALRSMSESDISRIINDYAVIKNVRTTNINKELKSCECRATLTFVLDEDLSREMKSDKLKMQAQIWSTGLLDIDGTEIYYNLQETADGELMAETYEIDGLDFIVSVLDNRLKVKSNNSKKENVRTFSSKDGYVSYSLKFLNTNRIEITFNQGTHEEIFEVDYKNGIITNPNFEDDPNNPQFKLEKDVLKVRDQPNGGYTTYYKK